MKKFLAMALALLMVAVLLPVTAMAETAVTTVDGLRAALQAGEATIILSNDITVEDGIQMSVTKDTAINFNGNTLKGAVESGSSDSDDPPTKLVLSDPNNSGEYSIDGNIVQVGTGYRQIAAITAWKPTVTIESGKYTHDSSVVLCQLQTQDPDAVGVVINGGTFDGKGNASVVADVIGRVVINDGTFNAYKVGTGAGECVYLDWGNRNVPSITTINGGTFNAVDRIFYVDVNTNYTQKIIINDGTFNVAEGGSLIEVSSGNASEYLTITGGTFNVDPSAYVAKGYAVAHTNGKYVVAKLAETGGTTQIEVSEIENNTGVTIPAEAAQSNAAIEVKLTDSTVEFDAAAAAAMKREDTSTSDGVPDVVLEVKSERAEDRENIRLNETQEAAIQDKSNAVVVELTLKLKVNGASICTENDGGFNGGNATVTIPYSGANASTKVYYIKENGELEQMTVKGYTDSTLTFVTSHFSHYVITTPTGAGSITIIVPDDTTDTTTTTETTKNPTTGMNDFVGAAVALAVISVIGAAAVVRKK